MHFSSRVITINLQTSVGCASGGYRSAVWRCGWLFRLQCSCMGARWHGQGGGGHLPPHGNVKIL